MSADGNHNIAIAISSLKYGAVEGVESFPSVDDGVMRNP